MLQFILEEVYTMSIFEIISASVLILACIFIVVVVLMKDTKTQMSQQISGTTADSFYQKNAGRTKDAILNKATVAAAIIFFVLAVAVNLINVYGKKEPASNNNNAAAVTSATSTASDDTGSTASDDTSAASDTSSTSDTSVSVSASSDTESDGSNTEESGAEDTGSEAASE